MMRCLRVLLGREQLFVQLLTVAQAAELDFDVFSPRQLDHALRQVHNLHRLPHVEDEDFAALAHGSRFEHQTASLGDEHEVADDVGMRHRNRTALLDLFLEDGNHRTVRAQHVAETRGDELRHALHLARHDGVVQALAIDLADTLRAAHHVRGIHRLVGRHHDELLHPVLHRQVGNDARAVHVVLDGHARVVLHHRHMLVGRRMEHIAGTMFRKDFLHVVGIRDARHNGLAGKVGEMLRHPAAHVVHRRFRLVNQYQFGRTEGRHLAHHLAADTAGGSRNQDFLSLQQGSDGLQVHFNLVARQQVLDVHLLQVVQRQVALAVPHLHCREHLDADACRQELVHHLRVVTEQFALQRRHHQDLHHLVLQHAADARTVHVHLLAHQVGTLHVRVVADEGHQAVLLVAQGKEALGQTHPTRLGSVDGNGYGLVRAIVIVGALHDETGSPQTERHHHPGDQTAERIGHGDVNTLRLQEPRQPPQHQGAQQRSAGQTLQVDERGIADNARIRMEQTERHPIKEYRNQQSQPHGRQGPVEVGFCRLYGQPHKRGEGDNQTVERQDAPMRQGFPGKIPIGDFE
ncbi:hypothetical protein EVA_02391 [gut metagenome]|uniref:Uncharacterized protein n=1 Tax=gut metagenome TaxID=749906 RepID=J9GP74_9ZZZZ